LKADLGATNDAVTKVTKKINTGLDALTARQENFKAYWDAQYFTGFEL
jgi:hypothetical protein